MVSPYLLNKKHFPNDPNNNAHTNIETLFDFFRINSQEHSFINESNGVGCLDKSGISRLFKG
jgi:hypothetical protein